jgi:hypothetical protein
MKNNNKNTKLRNERNEKEQRERETETCRWLEKRCIQFEIEQIS